MAFPETPLTTLVELLLGGAWTDITADVRGTDGIVISRGRRDEASQVEAGRCQLTLANLDGKYSLRNPESEYFGQLSRNTVLRVSVTTPGGTLYRRFVGEVSEWPPRWTEGGHDVWVPIEAYGILRRLRATSPPSRDSMRRHVAAAAVPPLSYWPFTDGDDSRHATEVVAGGQPIRALGVSGSFYQGQPAWGRGEVAPWLDPVAELTQREVGGTLTASVKLADVTDWSFDHVRSGSGRQENLFLEGSGQGTTADPSVRWQLAFDLAADTIKVWSNVLTDAGETETLRATVSAPGIFDAGPHHIRFSVADDGASGTDWVLYLDGALATSGNITSATKGLGRVTYVWADEDPAETTEEVALGHLIYWGEAPDVADSYRALLGHVRERAGRRIERLCAEDGVELRVHGALDDSQVMGPQRPGEFLDLLRRAEAVDGGVLGESREVLALEYRTGRSRYNQGVAA